MHKKDDKKRKEMKQKMALKESIHKKPPFKKHQARGK